jgi:hypothetical protein
MKKQQKERKENILLPIKDTNLLSEMEMLQVYGGNRESLYDTNSKCTFGKCVKSQHINTRLCTYSSCGE